MFTVNLVKLMVPLMLDRSRFKSPIFITVSIVVLDTFLFFEIP